ncbi:MAG: hypothetical protein ACW981_05275 [Candidatus Hodarchaeales archaeon]|jgi:hypothetical protein
MNLRNNSKEILSNKYLGVFKINKRELLDISQSVSLDTKVFQRLTENSNSEAEIIKKLHKAKTSLNSYDFNYFWEIFIFFLIGEVKTKTDIKNFIDLSNKDEKNAPNLDGRTIVLSSLFIKSRSDLQDSLYDYILNNYQKMLKRKEKEIIDSEISDFVYSILSILKIVLDEKSKIGKLVLDDITSSLMTAYNLTQKF